ncbi:MAG: type I-U CRISPR-associated protein Csx17 [Planctomycetota bacterium]|nr:MAG: type I-U CRISPR-associated protein Csx17 [Planctomycetota bacterium]
MFEIELTGCTPEPLMSYLKALGIFRLVAEQADPTVRLSWRGGVAVLHSMLDRESLKRFFLEEYRPTPIVAPWGGRSGFYLGSSEKSARDALDAIVSASEKYERLASFSKAIHSVRSILTRHGFDEKVRDDDKLALMRICRNELDDEVLCWLDAVFILTDDSRRFPPLLGTGGNEGSGSYVSTFAQVVESLLVRREYDPGLSSVLFCEFSASSSDVAVGHFNPGAIGGPNSSQGFSGGGGVNPWGYLFALEGTLVFAGAVARRYGTDGNGRAAFPFCVEAIAVGYGTDSDVEAAETRAELWLPIWSADVSVHEVKQLFSEGRNQLGRRQAKNAVEFALALAAYGVSRGVDAFVRYAFTKRNGLNFFAAPLGRIPVVSRPQARLLEDPILLEWLDRLRRACNDRGKTPSRYQTALRGIDRAMFDFANRSEQGNDAVYLTEVLRAIGRAERTLALAGLSWLKDKQYGWKIRPLFRMSPKWLKQADDGSAEFGLAASLASIQATDDWGSLREFLEPVKVSMRAKKTKAVDWNPDSVSSVWGRGSLVANLSAVFRRRQMEAFRAGEEGVPISSNHPARLDHVMQFLNDRIDEDKLADLIWGMLGINWDQVVAPPDEKPQMPVPMEYGIPKLLVMKRSFGSKRIIRKVPKPNHPNSKLIWNITKDPNLNANAKPDPNVFHPLSSGRSNSEAVRECVDRAALRLKAGGLLVHGYQNRRQSGRTLAITSSIPPERLLAAMLFPLSNNDLCRIANSVLSPPVSQE